MPIQEYHGSGSSSAASAATPPVACPPTTSTPPPDNVVLSVPTRPIGSLETDCESSDQVRDTIMYVNNNTGAAMAINQEQTMYLTPDGSPSPVLQDVILPSTEDRDKMDIVQDENAPSKAGSIIEHGGASLASAVTLPLSPRSLSPASPIIHGTDRDQDVEPPSMRGLVALSEPNPPLVNREQDVDVVKTVTVTRHGKPSRTGAKVDQELDWSSTTNPGDFTNKPLTPRYPSALFQCNSRYAGTQQSDRQTYNVQVRILTVDMDQCSCTGYLTIKGLTPEHETLQTYFTGEIIGGPGQRYGFRTKTSQWGASDKTDLTHWARFPAWRSYAAHTKKNLDFPYPASGVSWWQQEHIFMRWKEHFLVPDHKTKSIAGASFEGFYYICLNQIEGKISGIYFHSKSEKYQQLELKHEGSMGIWHRGVTPCVEFR